MATNNVINANSSSPLSLGSGGLGTNELTHFSLLKADECGKIGSLGAALDGQIPIGVTDTYPVLATLTAGSGIVITNAPGSITIGCSADTLVSIADSNNKVLLSPAVQIVGDGSNIITTTLNNSTLVISHAPNLLLPKTCSDLSRGTIRISNDVKMHFANLTNTFIGSGAGNGSVSGNNNVTLGNNALHDLTIGSENIALGSGSLSSCDEGDGNIALGTSSCTNLASSSANYNIGIGFSALSGLQSGTRNIAIGLNAGVNLGSYESNNLYLSNKGLSGESHTIRIGTTGSGDGEQESCFIAGINNTPLMGAGVLINEDGQMGILASSLRFKTNVTDMADRSSAVMKLRPVNFSYKEDPSRSMQYGLIAEETAEIMPEIVTYDAAGNPHTIRYHEMPAILLNELQKMEKRLKSLEERCTCKE